MKLQQHLYDTYNFKLNKADAINLTIEEFIKRIPDGNFIVFLSVHLLFLCLFLYCLSENSKNEYSRWISSLQKAWALVSQDLKTHGNKNCLFLSID